MRKLRTLAAIAAVFGLFGAGPAAGMPLDIDVILPLTGAQAFSGAIHQETLEVYEKYVNANGGVGGRPVHFAFHDDQSRPAVTVQLTSQLVAKNVPVILGSSYQAACAAMIPVVASHTVEFCLSPGLNPKEPNVFATAVSTTYITPAIYAFFRDRGYKRIAVITATDATGQNHDVMSAKIMAQPAFAKSMSIVDYEHMAPNEISVSAQMARIKAANPQGLIIIASGGAFGTVLHAMSDTGLDVPIITSAINMSENQLKQYAAFLPREMVFNSAQFFARPQDRKGGVRAAVDEFYAAYKMAGETPSPESTAWDPGKIVVSAFRALGPNATGDQMASYIASLHGFAGASGVYDFRTGDHHGLTDADLVWVKYQPGNPPKFVPVSKPGGQPL